MRKIIFLILFSACIQIFNGCKSQKPTVDPEAINAYINEYVNNQKYDKRLYDPPTPPWRDIEQHNGRIKPDSTIKNLKPLKIYIDHKVKYESVFRINIKPQEGFEFIRTIKPIVQDFLLNKTVFSKEPGVILEFVSNETFFRKHKKIQYDEGYGGFVSFRNLYYSKDRGKACFEVLIFKGKLNAGTSIIYAEKQEDGTWKFQSELKSIS